MLCVPLVLAATGSHVQVSIGGSTYSHGNKVGLPEPVYHAAPAPAPAPHHMPMMDKMPMKDNMAMDSMMEGMMDGMEEGMMGDMMDGMMEDMPKHAPAPFYHVTPAPAYHVTPSYHAHPAPAHAPVYHSKLAWGAGHAPAPLVHHKPVYHHPAPVVHHAPAYHHPAPAYHHAPKHNCSVVSVMEKVEVCTPALETKCMPVELMVKKVVEVEQCQEVTRTVCTESTELVANEVCTYSYMAHTQDSTATTVEVTFKKECMAQMVTVCQPGPGRTTHIYFIYPYIQLSSWI